MAKFTESNSVGDLVTYTEFSYYVALDNYQPPREEHTGIALMYTHPATRDPGIKIPGAEKIFKDAYRAFYLVDNGVSVTPYHVAGYNPKDDPGTVFLKPFPTNFKRVDGYEVDFSMWTLGPRRAYHLKVRELG